MRDIKELIVFLKTEMSMSELYQPAIILYLLQQDGEAERDELARILSGYDESGARLLSPCCYEMAQANTGKTQDSDYDRRCQIFRLNFDISDTRLAETAKEICVAKIQEWIEKRNRSDQGKGIDSSKRYRVLKAALGKCELCGIFFKNITDRYRSYRSPQSGR